MNLMKCEVCNGNELVKENGYFVCQYCGCRYAPDEAKKLMVEVSGPVEIVKGGGEMERLLEMADDCLQRGIVDEARRLYTQVTQDFPTEWRGWWGIIKCDPKSELNHTTNFENALAFAPESHRPVILMQQQLYNKQYHLKEVQSNLQKARQTLTTSQSQFEKAEKSFIKVRQLNRIRYTLLSVIVLLFLVLLAVVFSSTSMDPEKICTIFYMFLVVIILTVVVIKRNVKDIKQATARRDSALKEIVQLRNLIVAYEDNQQRTQQEISALKPNV